MKWFVGVTVLVLAIGIAAVNALHSAAPVFKAECHAAGGWALMSPAGGFDGCLYPPPLAK